tara:strand:+ start:1103 stop:1312 length:210 start_codon:yes stop_codon:yes gene_type:complete
MINEMMIAGLLMLGTVDDVVGDKIIVEFTLGNTVETMIILQETSLCSPKEGEKVLFYRDAVVHCFNQDV